MPRKGGGLIMSEAGDRARAAVKQAIDSPQRARSTFWFDAALDAAIRLALAEGAWEERQTAYDAINAIHGEAGCENGDTPLVESIHNERDKALIRYRDAERELTAAQEAIDVPE